MATYYAINAGGNWTAGGTWSTISAKDASRVGGVTAPTNADTCYLDDYSGNVTINAASACLTLDMNGNGAYGGTFAFGTQTLTVSGAATIRGAFTSTSGTLSVATGTTLSATPTGSYPTLRIAGAQIITSGGFTWPGALTFNIAGTVVLKGNLTVTGLVTISNVLVLNATGVGDGDALTLNGGLTLNYGSSGTTGFVIGGTGKTVNLDVSTALQNNLTFNCTSATMYAGNNYYKTGVMTYIAGTITTSNSTLNIGGSVTLNTNGITWNNITFYSNSTVTLGSDLSASGTLNIDLFSIGFSGNFNISCGTLRFGKPATNRTLLLVSGTTLTVTTNLYLSGDLSGLFTLGVASVTSSSSASLIYQGTPANCKVSGVIFTDIDASGSTQGIDNWYGGTLTRTTNITNRTSADIGGTTQNVFGLIG
jgi:hypothetical protein